MKDTQRGASLKQGDIEEIAAPQGVKRDLLEDFLDGIFLFEGVGRIVAAQLFLDDVNHDWKPFGP